MHSYPPMKATQFSITAMTKRFYWMHSILLQWARIAFTAFIVNEVLDKRSQDSLFTSSVAQRSSLPHPLLLSHPSSLPHLHS